MNKKATSQIAFIMIGLILVAIFLLFAFGGFGKILDLFKDGPIDDVDVIPADLEQKYLSAFIGGVNYCANAFTTLATIPDEGISCGKYHLSGKINQDILEHDVIVIDADKMKEKGLNCIELTYTQDKKITAKPAKACSVLV